MEVVSREVLSPFSSQHITSPMSLSPVSLRIITIGQTSLVNSKAAGLFPQGGFIWFSCFEGGSLRILPFR